MMARLWTIKAKDDGMKGSIKIWMVILGMVAAGTGITCLTNTYVNRQMEKMAEIMPQTQNAALALEQPEQERADEAAAMAESAAETKPVAAAAESAIETKPVAAAAESAAEINPEAAMAAGGEVLEDEFSAAGDRKKSVVLEIVEVPEDLQEALKEYQERFPQIDQQIDQMRKSETENNVYSVKTIARTEQRIWEREMEGIYRLLCDSLDEIAVQELKKDQQEWILLRESRAEEAARKNSGGSLETVDYLASMAESNRERAYALLEKYQE